MESETILGEMLGENKWVELVEQQIEIVSEKIDEMESRIRNHDRPPKPREKQSTNDQ